MRPTAVVATMLSLSVLASAQGGENVFRPALVPATFGMLTRDRGLPVAVSAIKSPEDLPSAVPSAVGMAASLMLKAGPAVLLRKNDEAMIVPAPGPYAAAVGFSLDAPQKLHVIPLSPDLAETLSRHLASNDHEAAWQAATKAFDGSRAQQWNVTPEGLREREQESVEQRNARIGRLDEAARLLARTLPGASEKALRGEIAGHQAQAWIGGRSHEEGTSDDLNLRFEHTRRGQRYFDEYRFHLARDPWSADPVVRTVEELIDTPRRLTIRTRWTENASLPPQLRTDVSQTLVVERDASGKAVSIRIKQEEGYPGEARRLFFDVTIEGLHP